MSPLPRTMISFTVGAARFNHRVAAIVRRQGHVLVCREDADDYVMFPGGRIEMGESSQVALHRELIEELGVAGRIGPLLVAAESFFERPGEAVHEVGLYYAVELPENFPFSTGAPCLVRYDEGLELKFIWVPMTVEALTAINLRPPFMRARLAGALEGFSHVIDDERPYG